MEQPTQVLYDSAEAAKIETVTGWRARTGEFWGDNEHMARYCGSTHKRCDKCGSVVAKGNWCHPCRDVAQREKFAGYERKAWDGVEPLHLHDTDMYFFGLDALADYCAEHRVKAAELALVFCAPNYAGQVDAGDFYQDILAEDSEMPDAIQMAFDTLNEAIKACREPLSWEPTTVAADPASVASWMGEG
jgi:hypothetical protein